MEKRKRGRPRKMENTHSENASGVSGLTLAQLNLSDSYVSLLVGLGVVLLSAILAFSFIRAQFPASISSQPQISSDKTKVEEKQANLPVEHKVMEGEDLKSISIKYYKTEEYWDELAQANELVDPNYVETGTLLLIPKFQISQAENTETTVLGQQGIAESERITGNTYTLKEGESLFDIALRAYGDGYRWPEISAANNLSNPDVIEPGTVLKIPR
jgi:nucleoid-associated protein YgaU